MDQELRQLCYDSGHPENKTTFPARIKALIQNNPGIDINGILLYNPDDGDGTGWTSLHSACYNGDPVVIRLLLAQPGIDVNKRSRDGETPFLLAVRNYNMHAVKILTTDSRVVIDTRGNDGRGPLRSLAFLGYPKHLGGLKAIIASGKPTGSEDFDDDPWSELSESDKRDRAVFMALLAKFQSDPVGTRREVRKELRWHARKAAELFAIIVFHCDGLLKLKDDGRSLDSEGVRFFQIASRLPMELQMTLCHKVHGSALESITVTDTEPAFRELSKRLLLT